MTASTEPEPVWDWAGIAGLAPTPQHRLQALGFFEAEIKRDKKDGNAAWGAISGVPDDKWLVWPKSDALRRFLSLWLEVDAETAWKVIAAWDDKEGVKSLKAQLKRANPALFATIEPKAGKQPPAAPAMSTRDQLLSDPLSLEGLEKASEEMKKREADDFQEIARALVDRDRAGAMLFLESNLQSQEHSRLFSELARQVLLTIAPGDLAEVRRLLPLLTSGPTPALQVDPFANPLFQMADRWDTKSLREAIPELIGDPVSGGKFTTAVLESLLKREPLTAVALLNAHPGLESVISGGLNILPTQGQAKAAREAIETAPESARAALADAFRETLVENDIGFYLANAKAPELNGSESAGWLHRDTQAATAWMAGQKEANWENAARTWVGMAPEACSAWVNSLPPGENRLQAAAGLISGIARHDPEMARQWLATIPPEQIERRLTTNIIQHLKP